MLKFNRKYRPTLVYKFSTVSPILVFLQFSWGKVQIFFYIYDIFKYYNLKLVFA